MYKITNNNKWLPSPKRTNPSTTASACFTVNIAFMCSRQFVFLPFLFFPSIFFSLLTDSILFQRFWHFGGKVRNMPKISVEAANYSWLASVSKKKKKGLLVWYQECKVHNQPDKLVGNNGD